jgi:hypothetical protein
MEVCLLMVHSFSASMAFAGALLAAVMSGGAASGGCGGCRDDERKCF